MKSPPERMWSSDEGTEGFETLTYQRRFNVLITSKSMVEISLLVIPSFL